ncbi:MAG: rubredoxin [Candidatus Thorarchaeota archaeon]
MKYVCSVCMNYEYDDSKGTTGIEKDMHPSDFPKGWSCPVCKRPATALRQISMKKERDMLHSLKTKEKHASWGKSDVLRAYRKAMLAIVDGAELGKFDQEVNLVSSLIGIMITITILIAPILELSSFRIYVQSFSLLLTILIWMAYRIACSKASLDLRFWIVAESLSLIYFLPFTILLMMVEMYLPLIVMDVFLSGSIWWAIAFLGIVLGGGHVQRFSANYTLSRWKVMLMDQDDQPLENPYTLLLKEISTDLYVDYLVDETIGQQHRGIIQRMTNTPRAYLSGFIMLFVVLSLAGASTTTLLLERMLYMFIVIALLSFYIAFQVVTIIRAQNRRLKPYLMPN